MSHCDPTDLALAALGEPLPDDAMEHARACPTCRQELTELSRVVAVGREAPAALPAVPDSVWDGIVAELARPAATATPALSAPALTAAPGTAARPTTVPPAADPPLAQVVALAPRQRRNRLFAVGALAAMAGAVVGGGVVWAALDTAGSGDAGTQPLTVAQAVLAPLEADVASPGQATVLTGPDGQVIRVDARGLPAGRGFYEVWLLDRGATRLVALGALPSGSVGTFTVPPGVSIEEYPVVDISLEPYDGDPGHSHESLLRGTLEA